MEEIVLNIDNECTEIEEKGFEIEGNSEPVDFEGKEDECTADDYLFTKQEFANKDYENILSANYNATATNEREFWVENIHGDTHHLHNSEISFTGYGRCECGCGSFMGSGNICSACHHPFDKHSRYKK